MPIVVFAGQSGGGGGGGSGGTPDFIDPGTGEAVPAGIEATFQYGTFTFNETKNVDKYRVLSIDGLDDPDVRDTREDLPTQHGEKPLNAFYGGRTIAFNGRIEAFSLKKLRDMQLELRTAFSDLTTEKKLWFLMGTPSRNHYIMARKFSKLQWAEEQTNDYGFYREFLITLRASDPRFYMQNTKTYILYPQKIVNGSFEPDTVGWQQSAASFTSTVFTQQSGWSTFGNNALRMTGTKDNTTTLRWLIAQTNPVTDMKVDANKQYAVRFDINMLNLGTSIESDIQWYNSSQVLLSSSAVYTVPNQLGVQSVVYSAVAPASSVYARVRIYPSSNIALDVIDCYIDAVYFQQIDMSDPNATPGEIHLPNIGNVDTYPKIDMEGHLKNVEFTVFSENGPDETFALGSAIQIANGDTYTIDSAAPSLMKGNTNVIADMDPTSDWPVLDSGDNVLRYEPDKMLTTSETSEIRITYTDTFI